MANQFNFNYQPPAYPIRLPGDGMTDKASLGALMDTESIITDNPSLIKFQCIEYIFADYLFLFPG